MSVVLACSNEILTALRKTILWRGEIERLTVTEMEDALAITLAASLARKPVVVIVDAAMPWARSFVSAIRADDVTGSVPIVVVSRTDLGTRAHDFLVAGATALLPFPPTDNWDRRLAALAGARARRSERRPVRLPVLAVDAVGSPVPAVAVNLSETGMLIESPASLRVGQVIRFSMKPPGGRLVRGGAKVVWHAGAAWFGMRFVTEENGS